MLICVKIYQFQMMYTFGLISIIVITMKESDCEFSVFAKMFIVNLLILQMHVSNTEAVLNYGIYLKLRSCNDQII